MQRLVLANLIFLLLIIGFSTNTLAQEGTIPEWIKNNAKWWSEGAIDDEAFVQGIEFLVKKGIISI